MKITFIKSLLATAAFVAASTASAAVVTIPSDVIAGHGSHTLTFSADLLGALDTGKVTISPDPSYVIQSAIILDPEGNYANASITTPMTGVQFDNTSGQLVSTSSTGGATLTAPALKSVSTGGSMRVSDLSVDLLSQKVYATITGANGVGTLNNVHLWNAANITGHTAITGPGTFNTQISGLSITTTGFNTFVQALGLLSLGKGALATVTDFGTITSLINNTRLDGGPLLLASSVPESSTYLYTLVGLAMMGMALRRKAN